jgi:hypothetical protein
MSDAPSAPTPPVEYPIHGNGGPCPPLFGAADDPWPVRALRLIAPYTADRISRAIVRRRRQKRFDAMARSGKYLNRYLHDGRATEPFIVPEDEKQFWRPVFSTISRLPVAYYDVRDPANQDPVS